MGAFMRASCCLARHSGGASKRRTRNLEMMDKDFGFARCRERPGMTQGLNRALQRFDQIGLLPGEAALIVRRAAEMAVGRSARVDWAIEIEMAADAARRQIHRPRS